MIAAVAAVVLAAASAALTTPVAAQTVAPDLGAVIAGDALGDGAVGQHWINDVASGVTVQVFDQGGLLLGAEVGYPGEPDPDGYNWFGVGFGLQLQPGYRLVATGNDSGYAIEMTVSDLTVTDVDLENGTVSGTTSYYGTGEVAVELYQGAAWDELVAVVNAPLQGPVEGQYTWVADFSGDIDLPAVGMYGQAIDSDAGVNAATLVHYSAGGMAEPYFAVSPIEPPDHMWGEGWLPDSEVRVDIDDPAVGGTVDFTTTIPTDGAGWFEANDLPFDIAAGHIITVSQGDAVGYVKTHEVIDLTITGVDVATDIVTGVGAPDTLTFVNVPEFQVKVTSDAAGAWTADLGSAGVDVVPGMTVYVFQADDDGDHTQIDYRVATEQRPGLKTIRASQESKDSVFTWGWEIGSFLTLTVDDPTTPDTPDLTIPSIEVVQDSFHIDHIFPGVIEIEPGYEVSLTDGVTVVDHVVGPLQITSADRSTDVVTGIGTPGIPVELIPTDGEDFLGVYYTDPEMDGNWQIQVPAGMLSAAHWLMSNQFETADPDEDSETQYDWYFAQPSMNVCVNCDSVEGFDWPEGAATTLTIDDPGTAASPDYQATETVGNDPAGSVGNVGFVFNGVYDVQPGHVVALDDGQTLISHVVQTVEVTEVDPAADSVSGTADPRDEIRVFVNPEYGGLDVTVQAEPDGTWVASFAGILDLVPGIAGGAEEGDPDPGVPAGTTYAWDISRPAMAVTVNGDRVEGFDWPADATVTLAIDDPDTEDSPDFTASETVGNDPAGRTGNVGFVFDDAFDVQPGHVVTLDDGQTLISHLVQTVEVTEVDPAADSVSGTADPGDEIRVFADSGNEILDVTVETQPDGTWVASFADVLDLVPGIGGGAIEGDPDPAVPANTVFGWDVLDQAYVFSGFTETVDSDAVNLAKAGRTIPLKFRVTTGAGDPVIDLAGVTVSVTTLECELGVTADQVAEYAAGQSGLQNLGDGYYQYNWKTPKEYTNSCKTVTLDLGDGIPHAAEFHFTR